MKNWSFLKMLRIAFYRAVLLTFYCYILVNLGFLKTLKLLSNSTYSINPTHRITLYRIYAFFMWYVTLYKYINNHLIKLCIFILILSVICARPKIWKLIIISSNRKTIIKNQTTFLHIFFKNIHEIFGNFSVWVLIIFTPFLPDLPPFPMHLILYLLLSPNKVDCAVQIFLDVWLTC